MDDSPTSHFQGLNANLAPNIVTALSRKQFLYHLERTPSPARFQRPQYNLQIPSGLGHPFQTSGIRDDATPYHADATSAYGSSLIEDAKSETRENIPIIQKAQSLNEEGYGEGIHSRGNFITNETEAYFQGLESEAGMRSTLHATQISTTTNIRSANEKLNKADVGIGAFNISPTALALPPPMSSATSVGSASLVECNIAFITGDESGYHSDVSLREESGYLGSDADVPLSDCGETGHVIAHSNGLNGVDINAYIQQPPSSQQYDSLVIDPNFRAEDVGRTSPRPLKKKLKRPGHSDPQKRTRNAALLAMRKKRAKMEAPKERCRLFDQLHLTEVGPVQKINSGFEEVLFDETPTTQSHISAPETHEVSIYHKRSLENSPQKVTKKPKAARSKAKMMPPSINFKTFKDLKHISVPRDYPRSIPTRQDFCDGFVGEESLPIGYAMAVRRQVRLPRPGALRRSMSYVCQLPLVRSRTFGDEPSLQEDNERSLSAPILYQSRQRERFSAMSDERIILMEEHHIPTNEAWKLNIITDVERHNVLSSRSNAHYSQQFQSIEQSDRVICKDESVKRTTYEKERLDLKFESPYLVGNSGNSRKEGQGCTSDAEESRFILNKSMQQIKPADQTCHGHPEGIDIDMVSDLLSEKLDNNNSCSNKDDSTLSEISSVTTTSRRRVTFNEDVEVWQQLAIVSAPALIKTTNTDNGSDYDHTDEGDEGTQSEKSDSDASQNDSENSSGDDEHSLESSSPRHDPWLLNNELPSTPIHRWIGTDVSDLPRGSIEAETQELHGKIQNNEIILDDGASTISERCYISDSLKKSNYEGLNWSLDSPEAPRRPALNRHSIEVDEEICESPAFRAPLWETDTNMSLNQCRVGLGSTQPTSSMPLAKRSRREPSIELGNDNWPPCSIHSSLTSDSQASRIVELDYQFDPFVVADVPTYFTSASQNLNQPLYKQTVPLMRSKSMPLMSQNFKIKGGDYWNADVTAPAHSVPEMKVALRMGSQYGRNANLNMLTRNASMKFGTPTERDKNPLLPFTPPLKNR